jgi:hypothetical protein
LTDLGGERDHVLRRGHVAHDCSATDLHSQGRYPVGPPGRADNLEAFVGKSASRSSSNAAACSGHYCQRSLYLIHPASIPIPCPTVALAGGRVS